MRPRASVHALLVPLVASLSACSDRATDPPSAPGPSSNPIRAELISSVPPVCGSTTIDLLAARDVDVGAVSIANDEDHLYVSFETTGGWEMRETHVAVATEAGLLPKAGKRLVPGRFPEKAVHDPAVTVVHYAIAIPGSSPSNVVVAAHADVRNGDRDEGAWVEGDSRDGGGWASYAFYGLADCGGGVGPDGGTVETDAGTLEIPAGALSENVEITAEPVDESELPAGVLPGTAVDLGPDGQQFAEPVILTISYDDTGLTLEQEEDLAIHLLQDDGTLLAIPSSVDAVANEVAAAITHFSVYSVALPEARLELRVGPNAPWYSDADGTVWAGSELEYTVLVRNLSASTIPGDQVTVTFDAVGPVAEFGLTYSTGTCALVQPDPSTYEFTCTLPNDIAPNTAGVARFEFVMDPASAGSSFDVAAGFTFGTWAANTGTISTDIIQGPTEADMHVFVDPDFAEVPVGTPSSFTVHVVNDGPARIDGAVLDLEIVGDVEFSNVPPVCQLDTTTGRLLTCPVAEGAATLLSGFGENWTVELTPTATGESQLIASLRDIQGATDPNEANNRFEAFLLGIAP